jgi:hypothetical protein
MLEDVAMKHEFAELREWDVGDNRHAADGERGQQVSGRRAERAADRLDIGVAGEKGVGGDRPALRRHGLLNWIQEARTGLPAIKQAG